MENKIVAISQAIIILQAKKGAWDEYHAITIHEMNNVTRNEHHSNVDKTPLIDK